MATTIARLSAVVTTDLTGFNQGMQRAAGTVKDLNTRTGGTSNTFAQLSKNVIASTGAFGRFGSSITTLAGSAGVATLAVGAIFAAIVKVSQVVLRVSEAVQRQNAELRDAFALASGMSAEFIAQHGAVANTLPGQMDKLRERIAGLTEAIFRTPVSYVNNAVANLTAMIEELDARFAGGAAAKLRVENEALKKATEQRKAEAEALKKLEEEHARTMEAMASRAESIRERLRTPAEIFGETLAELHKLNKAGLLDPTTLVRGLEEANKQLAETVKQSKEFSTASRITPARVGAAEFGTREAITAANQARDTAREQAETAKRQLAVEEAIKAKVAEGTDYLRQINDKPVVTFRKGAF